MEISLGLAWLGLAWLGFDVIRSSGSISRIEAIAVVIVVVPRRLPL